MKEYSYLNRIIDKEIEESLTYKSAIYVKGLKYIGKTTTCKKFAKTVYRLGLDRELNNLKIQLNTDSSLVFNKEKPILFDEWQNYIPLWNEIKYQIDESFNKPGLFLLTGSTIPYPKKNNTDQNNNLYNEINSKSHTGTGRFKEIMMRPLSLYESKESNGSISLLSLFDKNININGKNSSLSIEELIYATVRGGFPSSLFLPKNEAINIPKDYLSDLVNYDISDYDNVKRNPILATRLLKIYSKNICTLAKNSKMLNEIRGDDFSFSESAYYDYKNVLEKLFVIEDVEARSPLFKSKVNMTSTPKKNFSEPSLAIAASSLSVDYFKNNLIDYGFYFESLVIRDLRIYSSSLKGRIYYYHDRNGLESDIVLVLDDGRYALIEVKLTDRQAIKASEHLLKIESLIKKYNEKQKDSYLKMELPSALICIVGSNNAYTLNNGVHIVPIGSLKD